MAKTVMAMLPAELAEIAEPLQKHDELLTADELKTLALFEELKKMPSFERFPGFTVLRRCSAGRVMCSQGDAGATAFTILTTEDVLELRELQLESIRATITGKAAGKPDGELHQYFRTLTDRQLRNLDQAYSQEVEELRERLIQIEQADDPQPLRHVASANLFVNLDGDGRKRGLLHRFVRAFRRNRRTSAKPATPSSIPIDGPADIDAKTLQAPIYEGELFGEMSCMNRAPRSATVVVNRDCYMLEMIRNVLDMLHNDPAYKARMDATYRERVLEGHVRRLSIFQELNDEEFAQLSDSIELVAYDSGSIICEEGEPSDSFYVVRSGLVKVVANAWCQLRETEFTDKHWRSLCAELARNATEDDLAQLVWQSLTNDTQKVIADAATGTELNAASRKAVVDALNQFILQPAIPKSLGRKTDDVIAAVDSAQLHAALSDCPASCDNWSDLEKRTFFRLFLEHVCPDGMPRRAATAGARRTLSYLSRGEFFGEIGVMLDEPRSATCYAYDHPDGGYHQRIPDSRTGAVPSRVELMRIGKKEFQELVQSSARLREQVGQVIQERQTRSALPSETSGGVSALTRSQSPEFEQLGLIQGQQLMLIDLDRCTRCGACVESCVSAHDDGRTRLYLDGPRFEKYLIPLTCRKCLDPVCMIGCPVGAINRGDNGEILIRDWCIGCRMCSEQCPYGSIQMNELATPVALSEHDRALLGADAEIKKVDERAVVCDLCSSLPSQDPACVYACPHDAALRVNAREFFLDPAMATSDTNPPK